MRFFFTLNSYFHDKSKLKAVCIMGKLVDLGYTNNK